MSPRAAAYFNGVRDIADKTMNRLLVLLLVLE